MKNLHIVAFDNPFPPDYGGAIDVYYKLRALNRLGIKPVLHLFRYGRRFVTPLKPMVSEVFSYPREKSVRDWFSTEPFIVRSRRNKQLFKNLARADAILFEGIHTTAFANDFRGKKKIFLRAHNIETSYYRHLASASKNPFERLYYLSEAMKLSRFEPQTARLFDGIFTVHPDEQAYFSRYNKHSEWIPVFHPFDRVEIPDEEERIVLFHGNLSVAENLRSIAFLREKVFSRSPYVFVVAGKNPPAFLKRAAEREENFFVIPDPSVDKLDKLIGRARIHIVHSFYKTGVKLKLLYALYRGKYVIANTNVTDGTGLEPLVYRADSPGEILQTVERLMKEETDWTKVVKQRESVLNARYNNLTNARKMTDYVEKT